jgi:hypothetical protein
VDRSDTISPINENISLLEAERIAREREIRDGSPQQIVVNRINEVHATIFKNLRFAEVDSDYEQIEKDY